MKKIAVVGMGYVGLSNAILLSQNHEVVIHDIDPKKIEKLNNKVSPIKDKEIQDFLENKELNLIAKIDKDSVYKDAQYTLIAVPTDYDETKDYFDTSLVEKVIEDALEINSESIIIIKSTVPIGFTKKMREKFNTKNIIFSPEFLREGSALNDNLHPSRIIVGDMSKKGKVFAELLVEGSVDKDVNVLFTNSTEAEAVKLFSNTFLAMRVAFFNELDSFAEFNDLDSRQIIEGICLDPRIGSHYNNPSFGYGGYCLPKDTKQLSANFSNIPNSLIRSIVDSNSIRKDFITNSIIKRNPKIVGIYRLIMKKGSDNFRLSAILGVINRLKNEKVQIIIYEPYLNEKNINRFVDFKVEADLDLFKSSCDLVIANRMSKELKDIENKVYTRDLFRSN